MFAAKTRSQKTETASGSLSHIASPQGAQDAVSANAHGLHERTHGTRLQNITQASVLEPANIQEGSAYKMRSAHVAETTGAVDDAPLASAANAASAASSNTAPKERKVTSPADAVAVFASQGTNAARAFKAQDAEGGSSASSTGTGEGTPGTGEGTPGGPDTNTPATPGATGALDPDASLDAEDFLFAGEQNSLDNLNVGDFGPNDPSKPGDEEGDEDDDEEEEDDDKKRRVILLIIIIILLLLLLALGSCIYNYFRYEGSGSMLRETNGEETTDSADDTYLWISVANVIHVNSDGVCTAFSSEEETMSVIDNPSENDCDVRYTFTITGAQDDANAQYVNQDVYTSGFISPGNSVYSPVLVRTLPSGTYDVKVSAQGYDAARHIAEGGTVSASVTMIVE